MVTDIDTQLLEANRKRLLEQQDWVGIDHSKPVNLHFMSRSEKDRIGKRRRVRGQFGATARPKHDNDCLGYQPQPAGGTVAARLLPVPTQNDVKDIRIRVGTD